MGNVTPIAELSAAEMAAVAVVDEAQQDHADAECLRTLLRMSPGDVHLVMRDRWRTKFEYLEMEMKARAFDFAEDLGKLVRLYREDGLPPDVIHEQADITHERQSDV